MCVILHDVSRYIFVLCRSQNHRTKSTRMKRMEREREKNLQKTAQMKSCLPVRQARSVCWAIPITYPQFVVSVSSCGSIVIRYVCWRCLKTRMDRLNVNTFTNYKETAIWKSFDFGASFDAFPFSTVVPSVAKFVCTYSQHCLRRRRCQLNERTFFISPKMNE